MADPNSYPALAAPHVRLSGPVDYDMYRKFQDGISAAPADEPLVVSLTTLGGDPEVARAMGEDIRLLGAYQGRDALFLGKVAVYSAGATFMSYFRRENRFLTKGTRLMVHERLITKTINLEGPLTTCVATLKAALHEIEHSIRIEEEGFRLLVAESEISFEELTRKAPENWYIEAEEARDLGLVLDVI
jgi:ATP-dependent protease ClpP protease subunit